MRPQAVAETRVQEEGGRWPMGVRCELHELPFEGMADVVVVPDDGADDEEAGEGDGDDGECVDY